jgi:hypothetical protein
MLNEVCKIFFVFILFSQKSCFCAFIIYEHDDATSLLVYVYILVQLRAMKTSAIDMYGLWTLDFLVLFYYAKLFHIITGFVLN